MTKVYIVNGSGAYRALFAGLGMSIAATIDEAELVCFTGGADVTPSLYGDEAHPKTYNDPYRDAEEVKIFNALKERGIPMVGICRGAQFLNVMSGGRMYQHVTGHLGDHEIVDVDSGEHVYVSSTHHQMMMPADNAIILGISTLGGTREWFDGQVAMRDVSNTDYEVVYYHDTRCLCFQPHPEFPGQHYNQMRAYFSRHVNNLLHNSLIEAV